MSTKGKSVINMDKWAKRGAIVDGVWGLLIKYWYLFAVVWLITGYIPLFSWDPWGRNLWESTWWMIIQFPMFIATSTMAHFASHELIGVLNYLISYFILPPLLYLSTAYLITNIVKRWKNKKKLFLFSVIFMLVFFSTSNTAIAKQDIESNIQINLHVIDGVRKQVEYPGTVEIVYNGTENTSVMITRIKLLHLNETLEENELSVILKPWARNTRAMKKPSDHIPN